MKVLLKFFLLLLIFSYGCGNSKKQQKNEAQNNQSTFIIATDKNPDKRKLLNYKAESIDLGDDIINPGYLEVSNEMAYIVDFDSMYIYKSDLKNKNKLKKLCGGTGRGPSEFVRIAGFQVYEDKIYVVDENLLKVSVFDLNGNLLNSFSGKNYRMHRFKLLNEDLAISFSPPSKEHRLQKINLKNGSVLKTYFPKKEKLNPLVYEGQLGIDNEENFYFVGFSEPVLVSWDKKGEKRYSIDAVNSYNSKANYIAFSPGNSQRAYRYSPNALFYANDLEISNGNIYVLTKVDKEKFIDIYNSNNGVYKGSFNVNSKAVDIFSNDQKLYVMNSLVPNTTIERIEL